MLAFDRVQQFALQHMAFRRRREHRRNVALHDVAAHALRFERRSFGVRDQPFGVIGVVGTDAHTDTRGEMELVHAVGKRRTERRKQGCRERIGARRVVESDGKHDKLIGTEARDRIEFADRAMQAMRDRAQHRIARREPAEIVDGLEAIDVDEDHGRAFAAVLACGQRRRDALFEERAIRQIGDGIVIGGDRADVDVGRSDRQRRAGDAADARALIDRGDREIAQAPEPLHANRRRRAGERVPMRIDDPRPIERTRQRIPCADRDTGEIRARIGAFDTAQRERLVGRPDQRRRVQQHRHIAVARAQHAVQLVMRGTQCPAQFRIAQNAQKRRTEP